MIKKIIATLICIFALPVLVYADMGAPDSYDYEVTITNQNGVVGKDWQGNEITIPYDTKVKVYFEYEEKGVLYLDVEYNNTSVSIKAEDAKIVEAEFDWTQFAKNSYGKQYYTLAEVSIYKGPSKAYGETGKTVPANKVLDYTYEDEQWAYIEYEGTKGWIYIYSYSVVMQSEELKVVSVSPANTKALVRNTVNLYSSPTGWTQDQTTYDYVPDATKKVGELKAGEYKVLYYTYAIPHTTSYYVEQGETKGWLLISNGYGLPVEQLVSISNVYKVMSFTKDLNVYANLEDSSPVSGITIPKMTEVTGTYYITLETSEDYENTLIALQVTYEGKTYWIKDTVKNIFSTNYAVTYTINKDLNMYKEYNSTEVVSTISAGTKITTTICFEDNKYLVEYNGKTGWVTINYGDYSELEYIELAYLDNAVEEPVTPEEPAEPTKPEEKESLTGLQIGLICGGAALIATLTAIISIVLVNKKKKNKVEEPVVATEPKQENATTDNTIKVPSTTGVLPVVKEEDQNDEK